MVSRGLTLGGITAFALASSAGQRPRGSVVPVVDPEDVLVDVGRWTRLPKPRNQGRGVAGGNRRVAAMGMAPYEREDGASATVMVVAYADHGRAGTPVTHLPSLARSGRPGRRDRGVRIRRYRTAPNGHVTRSWERSEVQVHVSGDSAEAADDLALGLSRAFTESAGPTRLHLPVIGSLVYLAGLVLTICTAWPRPADEGPRFLTAASGGAACGFAMWTAGELRVVVGKKQVRWIGTWPISRNALVNTIVGAAIGGASVGAASLTLGRVRRDVFAC